MGNSHFHLDPPVNAYAWHGKAQFPFSHVPTTVCAFTSVCHVCTYFSMLLRANCETNTPEVGAKALVHEAEREREKQRQRDRQTETERYRTLLPVREQNRESDSLSPLTSSASCWSLYSQSSMSLSVTLISVASSFIRLAMSLMLATTASRRVLIWRSRAVRLGLPSSSGTWKLPQHGDKSWG